MSVTQITRMEKNGPNDIGLDVWDEIDASGLESASPVQRGHLTFNDEDLGLMAGIWDCTPFVGKLEPYAVNEFMQVLEGSLDLEMADGSITTINQGECFVIPKGLNCKWVQKDYMRKYFVIFDDKSGAEIPTQDDLKVIVLNKDDAVSPIEITDTSQFIGETPAQHEHDYFTDVTGQFMVGIWQSEAFERPVAPFNRYEMMSILEGSVTLSDDAGNDQVFKAGETAFVPKDAAYKWISSEFVNKYYCIFMPNK